ncbi:hypothetical protein PG993_008142 [Apiospora rasikravindrae]|uniref:Uncharacterized protein n=1 Tax=Apiospora rasikravindrae TaxID=990691 RepID=A0ABR1SZH8_9PEZI
MPPKRAMKRKSTGDELQEPDKDFVPARGTRSEPRPSTKRIKFEPKAEDRIDPNQWIEWIEGTQQNEDTYYAREMDRFFNIIQKSTSKCQSSLEEQVASLQPGESETDPIVESAYEIATSLRLEDSRKEGDAFFQQAQDALESSARLLAWHRETEEALKGKAVDTSILATWKKDRRDVKEVLTKGREHAGMLAANYLAPGTFSPSDLDNEKAGEHGKQAASMFQGRQQTEPEECWGPAAAQQFEHFRSLVNSAIGATDVDGHAATGHGGVPDSRRVQ